MTAPARGPTLRIVCVNDVYSLENLPRLRTLVRRFATEDPADAFLVTLAGDFVGPSVLSSLDAGRGMVDCMREVGVTHAILGNHEDDVPPTELRARLRELGAKVLAANVVAEPPFAASDVVEVTAPGGRTVRVGIVGVVMNDAAVYRRVPFGAARVDRANDAALREAAQLRERCACVLAMTHQMLDDDRALARTGSFPLVIGGHEHVPVLETIDAAWLVKAGSEAADAVVVDLAWPSLASDDGRPSVTARLEAVASYAEDAALRANVDRHMAKVHELEEAPLLLLPPGKTLSSVGVRVRQTSLGTLVCSLVRDVLGADACLFNAGGIRGAHDYEHRFTYGDLKNEVPFDNEVVVATLPGRVVRDAIAASRARAPAESGGFFQVDDRVEADARSVSVLAGAPLDEAREYRVALVRDFFLGMDRNGPLVDFAAAHPERVPPAGCGRDVKLVLVEAFALALWRRLGGFDAIDANRDGVVTAEEIAAAVARATGGAPSPVTAELVLGAMDADHDHGVSRDEAAAALRPKVPKEC